MSFEYVIKGENIEKKFRGFTLDVPKLKIPKGFATALIGENGAGKSTVIKLLLGYYSVTKGKILLNNENINNYDKCDYSQLFSFVGQSAELFEMSIAENILLKKCETDLEKEQVYGN